MRTQALQAIEDVCKRHGARITWGNSYLFPDESLAQLSTLAQHFANYKVSYSFELVLASDSSKVSITPFNNYFLCFVDGRHHFSVDSLTGAPFISLIKRCLEGDINPDKFPVDPVTTTIPKRALSLARLFPIPGFELCNDTLLYLSDEIVIELAKFVRDVRQFVNFEFTFNSLILSNGKGKLEVELQIQEADCPYTVDGQQLPIDELKARVCEALSPEEWRRTIVGQIITAYIASAPMHKVYKLLELIDE